MAEDGENQEPGDENAGEVNGSAEDNGGQESGADTTDTSSGGGMVDPPSIGGPPGGAAPPPGDDAGPPDPHGGHGALRMVNLPIQDELRESYLTYAMSVIVSRALPDVRDGLKPSQRRILVAMNDLNLGPGSKRVKCAKISGDTSGNYHPHGESVIYPTLVRMAQEWNMRCLLIDKQGNFGSVAGLPPAAMRYTEARMGAVAAAMLEDLKLDTVDYIPTYDEARTEPTVLPSKFPNLLINGSGGIAVGMATSIPPHNPTEVCDALIKLIEEPDTSIDELCEIIPGPDFPTGGIICGRAGVRRGYKTGRSTMVVRARCQIEEMKGNRSRIVITEIPYQQYRDRIIEKIAALVNGDRIKGISGIRDESDLKEPVRLVVELKRGEDPDVILNQLYQFSPLQDTFSLIFLALVDGKPRELTLKEMLAEFLRHRVTVIRRRTQFLLARARRRKHTVEGLLLALANIDEIIQTIRTSRTQPEAKERLMGIQCPASMMQRALGDVGFKQFQLERGEADAYTLTSVQTDEILRMRLGQLVNLEQEKLSGEHAELLKEIIDYIEILASPTRINGIIKDDLEEMKRRFGNKRRTEISNEELGNIDLEDLITEETMVVSISHRGYIKRTPTSVYNTQRRGGKGMKGAKSDTEDPIEHLFVASTHAYLLFFTTAGKVRWQKVYDIPQLARDAKGRAIVNLLQMEEGEQIAECLAVRDFNQPGHTIVMTTKSGLVKKTPLEQYSRPKRGGIIAIKLREGDELVDAAVVGPGDEVILVTSDGMAIRFRESDSRPMGRNTSGVKGISLVGDDAVVGMVVTDPEATLLTVCKNGYGKRTPFGPNVADISEGDSDDSSDSSEGSDDENASSSGSARYRTQKRGGKGLRDIKTSERNGKVIGIARVNDDDELFLMTAKGKLQRISAGDINVIGRNTQGVRIMNVDDGDELIAVVRVPAEENEGEDSEAEATTEADPSAEVAAEAEGPTEADAGPETDAAPE
ncbi:DNA gyrase subunit A [Rhodopirellula islandica]|uniref:DNA topoisomerase (ATP-hydrolyzing) n=1 Tax=Rhodopirellula islandica TaxID=595434 RepID=A0A0J1BA24_RHOIS|nr:DNA gyrase subunit A [Rhodopirellula islandica]KLU03570.1 DNA gyrase subunit A [Rhodopirellula islandica]